MHLLPPRIRQLRAPDPLPPQFQIPILPTLRHVMMQRPPILCRRPMTPCLDLVPVLCDFDGRLLGLYPVDVFDGVEVGGLHEGFDVAVVADAALVFCGEVEEVRVGGFVGGALLKIFAGVLFSLEERNESLFEIFFASIMRSLGGSRKRAK